MKRRLTTSRILVTILALVVACILCAATPGTPNHKVAKAAFAEQDKQDKEDQGTAEDKMESAQNDKAAATADAETCEDVPGGSAGGGTFTASGVVNDKGDAIIFKNKRCAVENTDVLKAHKGHHVVVTGRVLANNKAVHVDSLRMPAAAAAKPVPKTEQK